MTAPIHPVTCNHRRIKFDSELAVDQKLLLGDVSVHDGKHIAVFMQQQVNGRFSRIFFHGVCYCSDRHPVVRAGA